MIDIQIKGEFLEMPQDGQVTINLVNPLFDHDLSFNSHSHKFNVANTDTNRRLTEYIDHALAVSPSRTHSAQAWLAGMPWLNGELNIPGPINQLSIGLSFEENADYRELIENTLIKDLPLQSLNIAGAANPGAVFTIDLTGANGDKAALLLYDTVIWTTYITGMTEANVLANLAQEINNADIPFSAVTVTNGPDEELHISPTDPDTFFIDTNPDLNGHTWNTVSYTSSGTANAANVLPHLNNVAAAAVGTYAYAFPPIKNPNFYGENVATYSGYINLYDPVAGSYLLNSDTPGEEYRTAFVPMVSYAHILEKVCEYLGLEDVSIFTGGADFTKLFLYNNKPIEREFGGVTWIASNFDLTDHVPQEWTIKDFLLAVQQYNLAKIIDPVKKSIELFEKKEVSRANYIDLRDQSLIGYNIIPLTQESVGYRYKKDSTDALFEDNLAFGGTKPANEKKKIEAPVAPLFEIRHYDPVNSEAWLVPEIAQQAYTRSLGLTPEEASPRCFFYLGMHDNAEGNPYPTACHSGQEYDGTQQTGFGLQWDGATGIYAQKYQPTESWMFSSRLLRSNVRFDIHQLRGIQPRQALMLRVLEGEVLAFWKVIKVTVNRTGIVSAQIETAI